MKPTGPLPGHSIDPAPSPTPKSGRLPCQVCGRPLVPRKDGTARRHGRWGDCQGSGYRLLTWPVGQKLAHYAGSVWEVVGLAAYSGTSHQWMTEYRMRCLRDPHASFGNTDREQTFHGEYLHRHGWTAVPA